MEGVEIVNALFFLITFLLLLIIFASLAMLKRPVYRLSEANVIRLFELVLAGGASEDDWNVFIEMPIRYDDELESVRLRCVEISEDTAQRHQRGYLLSKKGLEDLEKLLEELKGPTT